MTPTEASKKSNEGTVYFNIYGDTETLKKKPTHDPSLISYNSVVV